MTRKTVEHVVDWKSAIISEDSTVRDAIKNLNDSGIQIVLVVTRDNRLLGTLTDGDIRRGLLNGINIEGSILEVMSATPVFADSRMTDDFVLDLMLRYEIRHIPILDEAGRLKGLRSRDYLGARRGLDNVMVIMCGGRGIRMMPHTMKCPKPMLSVDGVPMLEHIVRRASRNGVSRFVFAVHYLSHIIEDYFGDGSRFGIQIDYLREESPLGTAGALSLMDITSDESIIVTNGDVLTEIDYGHILQFHQEHNAFATMAVKSHEWEHPFGVVNFDGVEIVGFDEKPLYRTHINAGVYVLETQALKYLTKGAYCDMPTLFSQVLSDGGRAIAYPMHEQWLDVGRPEDYKKANQCGQVIND